MQLALEIGHRTDVGRRRDHNEDCVGVFRPHTPDEIHRRGTLLAVADGMGGYAAGEVASRTALAATVNAYYGDLTGSIDTSLRRALTIANDAVRAEARQDSERTGMGTTIALAVICEGELLAANVGDSRVYLLRDGQLSQVSRDHSLVAALLDEGKITAEEARHHPHRNVITRSIGGQPEVEVETYSARSLQDGDVVLICSDGLWGMVTPGQILELTQDSPAQDAADALIRAANEAGGHDNITVIVCRVRQLADEDDRTEQIDALPLQLQDTQPIPRIEL